MNPEPEPSSYYEVSTCRRHTVVSLLYLLFYNKSNLYRLSIAILH